MVAEYRVSGITVKGGQVHLSIRGNMEEFRLPASGLANQVAKLRLGWGWIHGHWQPVIMDLAEEGAYNMACGKGTNL
ncbi:MAG: hypothetical protein LUE08_07320 [Akkermansiaceae bacterium]|nr:hypothetical protein [Akkermansiaceae bacterium]